jgi:two-component system OmpR family sensor kinase
MQSEAPGFRPPLAVQPVLRSVIQDLMPEAERKSIDLAVGHMESVAVAAHEIELTLLLRNILDNAIRYAAPGGKVEVEVHATSEWTTIEIIDDGPGIAEQERARVFDPFYRIDGTAEAGSGLGLSIVRTIADRVGGIVELDWADMGQRKGLHVRLCLRTVGQRQV